MSNRNIFMDMGADTEVELHLKSNAMSFSKLFGDGDKIKSEYLPENASGGNVDFGPLEARVAALENAPKVADKSAEVTTLQGTVAEHTTNIASNVQRITALESRPVPEGVNLQPLTERVTALENGSNLGAVLLGRCLVSEIPYWINYSDSLKGIFDSLLNSVAQLGGAVLLKNPEASLSPYNERWLVFQFLSDGTLYRINMESKPVDASEAEFPDNDALYIGPNTKFFKAEWLGRIPGIPGTYTIREDYYIDPRPYQTDTYRMEPSIRRQLEPVADQIKKLLGLS